MTSDKPHRGILRRRLVEIHNLASETIDELYHLAVLMSSRAGDQARGRLDQMKLVYAQTRLARLDSTYSLHVQKLDSITRAVNGLADGVLLEWGLSEDIRKKVLMTMTCREQDRVKIISQKLDELRSALDQTDN